MAPKAEPDDTLAASVTELVDSLAAAFDDQEVSTDHLSRLIGDALSTPRLRDDLGELFRADPRRVESALARLGVHARKPRARAETDAVTGDSWTVADRGVLRLDELTMEAFGPPFDGAFEADPETAAQLSAEWDGVVARVRERDPFLSFYRTGLAEYVARYRSEMSPRIHDFVSEHFGTEAPTYLVTVGIGANEQFWHFAKSQLPQGGRPEWIIADSPKDIARLPANATADNTLVMEFSRSGKTQEIVKFDEFLDARVPRIIFANSGPLAELAGRRPTCLRLDMADAIPGRFSKNLSPIVLAPFDVLGLPFEPYWARIAACIDAWDLADPASPPAALARYIRAAQLLHGANHIYLGCNDEALLASCDELVQFWNESVNKGNDLSMSRYFGLPRDSHLNVEGLLSNAATKASIFVLRRGGDERFTHPLRASEPDPVNPDHAGLSIADVDYALARANVEHFGTRMPTVAIEVDEPELLTSATLSQLWTDTTYVYATMIGVNPGSNPEVRHVRDRAEDLLTEAARAKRG